MKTPRASHSILLGTISTLLAATLPICAQTTTSPGSFVYILTQGGELATATTGNFSTPSAAVAITGVTAGETLVGMDVRPQNQDLYALGVNATTDTATLYHVSAQTAVATAVGTASSIAFTTDGATPVDFADPATVGWDIDFNPAVDRVRVVAGNGVSFRINPNTGAAVDGNAGVAGVNPDGSINGGSTTVDGAAYTNNRPNNGNITTLYTVDATTDSLFIQNPPNAGTQVLASALTLGGNPLNMTRVGGFDILPGVNAPASNAAVSSGSALLEATVGGVESLYSVNLVTGQCTALGTTTLAMRSFAVRPNFGAAIVLSGDATSLVRFDPTTAGTTTSAAIAGVTAGDTLVGIDFRPQTGQLMGLGVNATADTGTLYLLDPQTGAATAIGTPGSIAFVDIGGNPVDLPDPATTGYGFDFNPTVDRIRVIVGNGLNFRANPNTGAPVDGDGGNAAGSQAGVNPDGVQSGLSNSSSGADGAAYTNSFGQPLSGGVTTLYTLDATSNSLYIQNPPNVGTQVFQTGITLGGSPLDITSIGGFDIPSTVTVSASSTPAVGAGWLANGGQLYRIDLATGVATSFGTIGSGNPTSGLVILSAPAPEIAASGNNTEIADGDVTPSVTDGTDFGTVGVLDPAVSRTFTITNSGTAPLNLSGAVTSSNPAFTITQPAASSVAENGGTATFIVTFTPTASGPQTSSISIGNDDANEALYNFNVVGTGNAAPVVLAETNVQIAGAPMGTVFGKLTTAGDATDASVVLGKITLPTGKKVDGLVRGGTVILKVGDTLAVADGAAISKLFAMSNGAFLATLKTGTGTPKVTGGTSNVVLYENAGNLSLIARSSSGAGGLKKFSACAATDAGDVFFTTSTGLFVKPAAGTVTALVTKGQTINLGNGDKKVTVISAMPSVKGSLAEGRVLVGASGVLARITMGKEHAIAAIPANATGPADWQIVAATGGTAPGAIGNYATLGQPAAEGTAVVFQATLALSAPLSVTKANDTIVVSDGQVIAREGQPAAGVTGGVFAKFSEPAAGSAGRASFTATLSGVPAAKKTGLWHYTGTALELVARVGEPAPGISGGVTLGAISSFAQPGGGLGPVFSGTVKGTGVKSATSAALWAVPTNTSTAKLIVRTGDKFTIGAVATERTLKSFKALQLDLGTEGTARGYTDESVIILGTFTDKSEIALEFPILGGM